MPIPTVLEVRFEINAHVAASGLDMDIRCDIV